MKIAFKKQHPAVILLYFAVMFVMTCTLNAFYLLIILLSSCIYLSALEGKRGTKTSILTSSFIVLFVGVFNMLFVRKGVTVLFSVFNVDFTLEALLFGFSQGLIFASLVVLLMLYGKTVGSDKLISVFGRVTPYLSLLFSMVLQLVSRFRRDSVDISNARLGLVGGNEGSKIKNSFNNFSALVTKSLEGSITTSDSMRARGYGKNDFKMSFAFHFTLSDVVVFLIIATSFVFNMVNLSIKGKGIVFEPQIIIDAQNIFALVFCTILSFLPLIIDLKEGLLWRLSRQKI